MMLHSAAWRRAALHATSRTTLSSAAPAAAASLFTSRDPPAATCAAQQRRHMGCGGGGGVDAYKALGLSKTCSQDEIKKAYRKLAKQWHPDLNQDKKAEAEKKFKEISEAYQMISDADKRKQYDMFGGAAGGGCGGMGGGFPGGMGGNVDPEELFKQMFGGDKGASIFKDLENLVKSGKMQGGGMPGGMGGMGGMPGGMPGGMGGAGGPGAFYSVNLADILGKAAAAGGGAGGFPGGFPGGAGGGGGGGGGFPGGMNMSQFAGMGGMGGFGGAGGSGGSGEQTIQQIVMRPDGKRAMRTTKITFKNGKPHSEVTEKLLQ